MSISIEILTAILANTTAAHAATEVPLPPAYFYATADAEQVRVHIPAQPGELEGDTAVEDDAVLATDDARVPSRLAQMKFDVVALPGQSTAALDRVGFEARTEGAKSWWTSIHKLPETAKTTGLAIANPLGAPSLRGVEPVKIKSADGERWVGSVATVLDEELVAIDRTRLGRKVLSQARLSVISGTFPDNATALAVLNVPLRSKDPEATPRAIRGLFTLHADGSLATMLVAPRTDAEVLEVEAIGDVDADGLDDIVWKRVRPEHTQVRLLRWKDEGPRDEALVGPVD